MLERHGDKVVAEMTSISALAVDMHGGDAELLARDPNVEGISVDAPVHATDAGTSVSTVLGVGLRETLGVTSSWTGAGVGIAVIDSGLDATGDFGTRVRARYDFTTRSVPSANDDGFGHGTHVSGLAAGDGTLSESREFMGLAPGAHLIVLRVLDDTGAGSTSDVIAAVEFAIRNKAALDIDIINLSLGHPIYEPAARDPLVLAVERAVRAGIVVVVAAGNHGESIETGLPGYGGITSPGNAPSAITVGALDTRGTVTRADDRMTSYSSRGPTWYDGFAKPDLVAPGHNHGAAAATASWLYASYPDLRLQSAGAWNYMRLSGTSMAAAVTSGVVAHMLEASAATNGRGAPPLTPNAIKAILQYTAIALRDDGGAPYDPLSQGAGALNAAGAIELARAVRTARPPGSFWLDARLCPAAPRSSLGGEVWPWSRTVVWGSTLAGGSTVSLNQPAWETSVAWGDSSGTLWASGKTVVWGSSKTVVWGSDVVWADAARWASTIVWGSGLIGASDVQTHTVVWGSSNVTAGTVVWGSLDVGALTFPYDPARPAGEP